MSAHRTRQARNSLRLSMLAVAVARCGGDPATMTADASLDASLDVSLDVSIDASLDARADVPLDVVLPPSPLIVRSVSWNSSGAELGDIAAVAEPEGLLVLFGQRGMQVLAGGAVTATDNAVTAWRAAALVPAGDGTAGEWTLGVAEDGRVWRVRDRMRLEDVTSRYALTTRRVRSVATLSGRRVAFGYEGGVAVADGTRVMLWSDPAFAELVGAGDRVAARNAEGVRVFDVTAGRMVQFTIAAVTGVAFNGAGRLVVTVSNGLYVENDRQQLESRVMGTASLRGVVRSGDRVWLASDTSLALWDGAEVHPAADAPVPAGARLLTSPSGDVWVLSGARLTRYGFVESPDLRLWEETVRPVFARRCVPCHLPGGTGNADLTGYRAWQMRRADLRTRVVTDQSMPPPPGMLTDAERSAVARWLDADAGVADGGVDVAITDAPRDVSPPRDATVDVRDATVDARDAATDVRDATVDARDAATDVRDAATDVRDAVVDAGPVTYAAVDTIFQRSCVRCHGTSGSLNLSVPAAAYTALVSAPTAGASCRGGGRVRVVPRDPMGSLLYLKLVNMQDCGNSMPRGAVLPAADIETVRRWIAGGALR